MPQLTATKHGGLVLTLLFCVSAGLVDTSPSGKQNMNRTVSLMPAFAASFPTIGGSHLNRLGSEPPTSECSAIFFSPNMSLGFSFTNKAIFRVCCGVHEYSCTVAWLSASSGKKHVSFAFCVLHTTCQTVAILHSQYVNVKAYKRKKKVKIRTMKQIIILETR